MLLSRVSALACIAHIAYGSPKPAPEVGYPQNPESCNINTVDSHAASWVVCNHLLIYVKSIMGGTPLQESPRALCIAVEGQTALDINGNWGGEGQCCISWSTPLTNGTALDLANAAQGIMGGCPRAKDKDGNDVDPGNVTAFSEGFLINGELTKVCVSNRPDGC
ncbi:hypothetical protein BGZ63DRAFT_274680 [Mariannaea sp. PMI_226]|nr:hypothetical protein BGZ63DRAFT_274680 [Mariannaea sp. PMI_226]